MDDSKSTTSLFLNSQTMNGNFDGFFMNNDSENEVKKNSSG